MDTDDRSLQDGQTLPASADGVQQLVYLSGAFIPRGEAVVDAFDRGFLYGDGFFETLRVFGGRAGLLERHLLRLAHSCEETGWSPSPDGDEIGAAAVELIERNGVDDGYMRITVSRGRYGGDPGVIEPVRPTVLIEARSIDMAPPGSASPFQLLRSGCLRNEHSPTVRHKSLSYLDNLLALEEARRAGADDVYFLNASGHLCEGARTNLFWVRGDEVFTPAVRCGLLPGITRAVVMEIAEREGIACRRGCYGEEELLEADEVFCTNSLRGVIPVKGVRSGEVEQRWEIGAATRRFADAYARCCVEI